MLDVQLFHLNESTLSILRASNASDSTLLITGATGTGKSHLAQAVHRSSVKRSGGRWCKVNLATLSENLIESELFGHERGAFTGADSRRLGRLEACSGGTVFLDEIGELPLRLQAKLLDFIQYKKICPVGSNREIELDVRIIAATNRDLEAAVKAGEFRADLYHRLNVFHVKLGDLSTKPAAVMQFATTILAERAAELGKKITGFHEEVERYFRHYAWPGNIRELENVLEFAAAMESGPKITLESLPQQMREHAYQALNLEPEVASEESSKKLSSSDAAAGAIALLELPITMDYHATKDSFERTYIEQMLKMCSGQINLTSRRIGLNKVSLTEKIKKHGIDWKRIRYEALGPSLGAAS